jgi:hypothetical protein
MSETIVVDSRFCGPPESGNGGYVCGLLGRRFPGAAQVSLRQPPPLDRDMRLTGDPGSGLRLLDGDRLIAEALTAELDLPVPRLPGARAVEEATLRYTGFHGHLFPRCFVCGPAREPGDGLRVFAGALEGETSLAAPWTPDPGLGDATGNVRPEFIWASLDCPGYFAVAQRYFAVEQRMQPMLLGRLTVERDQELAVGQSCTVLAWSLGQDGRKYFAGTALFDSHGQRVARARAVWVALKT